LATSVRALAALKRDGRIGAIGLSNVTVGQIEEARRITDIDSIPGRAERLAGRRVLSGVADYCARHQLTLLAHRPLGRPPVSRRERWPTRR
jgi:aryl-alcohol dehydrogenase-like predicted oxidoreductase